MSKQEKTELSWKVEDLERRLKASNDLIILLLASLPTAHEGLSKVLLQQFVGMKDEDFCRKPEFESLLDRAIDALGPGPLILETVD
ncbi:MAG: hypothetical protein KKC24_23730 [Gammaproteobacteria bacterium]|nr:hypothetical protein [Gammaproteobacteria bacterium]MBU0821859.1 hypothetical protein [Gammaproteobacteria bacterium]MBU0843972.1 hypothetical protein [Gammaproteobacteria bacterium]MBU1842223.1 hypothetical protein [Gammaproteobacteria bacterium]